jgi:hypothetical protein
MDAQIWLKTANSSHKRCFICGRMNTVKKLARFNSESIFDAYTKHAILLKNHARCCRSHLVEDGKIAENELQNIYATLQPYPSNLIHIIQRFQSLKQPSVFDRFKEFETLDDQYCKRVTGWSKNEFFKFAEFITSIYGNDNRDKYQLIALYRNWLCKGTDQETLALLFGEKTTQQHISNYLNQIREAIYKDFVPHYLGVNREKEFFLKHNNITTKILHELEDDCLAIFVDGTYCRLEKSLNNSFQYKSFSMQKMDSLIKPFVMCCADGYIIDCYGPFQANLNDAQILRFILETDTDLQKILEPNKTMVFMDRGLNILIKSCFSNRVIIN